MPVLSFLVRLCVLAFVTAGLFVEIVEWQTRRHAIRRLLADIPHPSHVERPPFETPTLAPLGRITPGTSHEAVLEHAAGLLSERSRRSSRAPHRTG
jgi:hypothetical protein